MTGSTHCNFENFQLFQFHWRCFENVTNSLLRPSSSPSSLSLSPLFTFTPTMIVVSAAPLRCWMLDGGKILRILSWRQRFKELAKKKRMCVYRQSGLQGAVADSDVELWKARCLLRLELVTFLQSNRKMLQEENFKIARRRSVSPQSWKNPKILRKTKFVRFWRTANIESCMQTFQEIDFKLRCLFLGRALN